MIAAVRVRGKLDVDQSISRTLHDLKLRQVNQVVVFEENDSIQGMLNKAKDYITFGDISDDVLEQLAERAGKEELEHGETVKLSPPTRGYEDTKKQVGQGGTLGKRESMDDLIQNMV